MAFSFSLLFHNTPLSPHNDPAMSGKLFSIAILVVLSVFVGSAVAGVFSEALLIATLRLPSSTILKPSTFSFTGQDLAPLKF